MDPQKPAPENTTEAVRRDPSLMLAASMGGGVGRAVEDQERSGQGSFVASDTLPADMRGDVDGLKAAGVVFGELVEGDPLFRYVTLPPGWTKEPTEHSMWSRLFDDRGNERAMVFYKAAFYDRSAFLSINPGAPPTPPEAAP